MNDHEFERLLASVVDDGPLSVDERVIEHALAAIPATPQRSSRAGLLRRLTMRPRLVPVLGITVLVAAVGLGAVLWLPALGPSASPETSPSPTFEPTQTALDDPIGCPEGEGAVYSTLNFRFPMTIDLSTFCRGTWQVIADRPTRLTIALASPVYAAQVSIAPLGEVRLRASSALTDWIEWPRDAVAWFSDQPGFTVSGRSPVSGELWGRPAQSILVHLDPDARDEGQVLMRTPGALPDDVILDQKDYPRSVLFTVVSLPDGESLLAVVSARAETFLDEGSDPIGIGALFDAVRLGG